jgi:multiple sugar transport system substrate-binding protein
MFRNLSCPQPSRRMLPLVALLSAAVLCTAACATVLGKDGGGRPSGPITVVSGQQSQNGSLLSALLDRVNKATPDTPVTLRINNDTDVATAQKALLDISAGKGPDAVRVTSATYRTLVDSGVAQPVDDCLRSDPATATNLKAKLVDDLRVNGRLYEIPWYVTANALFYNAELFTQAGLDPNHPPTTTGELHAAAQRIAALPGHPGGGIVYFGNDYNFQGFVASLGGTVYDPQANRYTSDTPQAAAVFDLFAAMTQDRSSPVFTNFFADSTDAFAGGRLGMMVTSTSSFPQLSKGAKFDLRMAPVPAMDGGRPTGVTSTNGFVITTKDPARQQATCRALLGLLTPQAVTQTVQATATIPLNRLALGPTYLESVYRQHPDWVAVRDQATVPWQSLPGGTNAEYTARYTDLQTHVLLGQETPAAAGRELDSAARQLLDKK